MKESLFAPQMPIDKDKIRKIEIEKQKKIQSPIDPHKIKKIEDEKKKNKRL